MMFLTIPAGNTLPWYQFQITLSGSIFLLLFRFNSRMNRWTLDIEDPTGNQIITGIPILIGVGLTGQYVTLSLPPGPMFATDDTNQDTQPIFTSFGSDHTLWYGDPDQ